MQKLVFLMWVAIVIGIAPHVSARTVSAVKAARQVSRQTHVVRRIPRDFHIAQKQIYLWKWDNNGKSDSLTGSVKRWARSCQVGLLLQSDDLQCEVIYSVAYGTGSNYRSWIKYDLLDISQGQDTARFEDHVTVMTGQAVRPFNADSMFLLELPIEPMERDGSLYTRCVRMYLTRKGHTFLDFVWFFTDEGYARRQEYLRAIEGKVYFKKRQESPHRPTK